MNRTIKIMVMPILVVFIFSCAGATSKEKGVKTGVLVGAASGAILGQAIGRNTEGTLIGAGIGALVGGLAGHQIGSYMDRQEQALRDAMAESDAVSIKRTQDVLTATFKGDVFFDFDSSTLKPGAYTEISRVSNILNQYPKTAIRVEGHTDATGPEMYNQALSERRAQAVKNALTQSGVNPGRILTVGFGESQPISSSDAMNRRVNIVIIPITQG